MSRISLIALLVTTTMASAALAEDVGGENVLTCMSHVAKGDTAETIVEKFKGEAVITELPGAEGEILQGVAIFPDDPDRRLNVFFFDDELTDLATIQPDYEATAWTVAGLTVGMSLDELRKINGDEMTAMGFEWDYGGYITSFGNGNLENIEGGCGLSVRLEPTTEVEIPMEFIGDQTFSTSMPGLDAVKPVISSLALTWAAK